jgi:hypothetical protein
MGGDRHTAREAGGSRPDLRERKRCRLCRGHGGELYRRGLEPCITLLYYMKPLVGLSNEVREATNKEPHVCGRARVGERPVSR